MPSRVSSNTTSPFAGTPGWPQLTNKINKMKIAVMIDDKFKSYIVQDKQMVYIPVILKEIF